MTVLVTSDFTGKCDGQVTCEEHAIAAVLAGDELDEGLLFGEGEAHRVAGRYGWHVKQRTKTWWRVSDPDEGWCDIRVRVAHPWEEEA